MLEFNATFFVAMFSFIIFMLMMNSILYKPLSKIAQQRENIIKGNYCDAQLTNEKIDDLNNQHRTNLEETRAIAKEQFNKDINNYKLQKNSIIENAKLVWGKDYAIKQAQLEGEEKSAKIVLKSQILNLASLIASKLLSEDIKIEKLDKKLIDSCFD